MWRRLLVCKVMPVPLGGWLWVLGACLSLAGAAFA